MKVGQRLAWLLSVALVGAGCSTTFSAFSYRSTNIQRIQLGDTMEQVRHTLGEPHETLVDEFAQGPQRVLWVYDAAAVSEHSVSGSVRAAPRHPFSLDTSHQLQRLANQPSYLIVFLDGVVSEIIRQS